MIRPTIIIVGLFTLLWLPPTQAKIYLTPEETLALAFERPTEAKRHELTWDALKHQAMERKLDDSISQKKLTVYSGEMKSGKGRGFLVFDSVLGKHELIDYAVLIGADGKVRWIEILTYRESYGGQIRGAGWRDQFKGSSIEKPPHYEHDISNISGATLSCRHVTEGVKKVLVILSFFKTELRMDDP